MPLPRLPNDRSGQIGNDRLSVGPGREFKLGARGVNGQGPPFVGLDANLDQAGISSASGASAAGIRAGPVGGEPEADRAIAAIDVGGGVRLETIICKAGGISAVQ